MRFALDGVVVDASGKPVARAEVHLTVPDIGGFGASDEKAVTITGPDGSFHLDQLDPDDKVPIRARTKDAATNGAIIVQTKEQKTKGKLTVSIDPQFAFRVKGRVVDQRGKPVAGVPATISWSRMLVSEKMMQHMGIGSGLEAIRTDSDGLFVSQRSGREIGTRSRSSPSCSPRPRRLKLEEARAGSRLRHDRAGRGFGTHRRPGHRLPRPARRRGQSLQPGRQPAAGGNGNRRGRPVQARRTLLQLSLCLRTPRGLPVRPTGRRSETARRKYVFVRRRVIDSRAWPLTASPMI